jgi:hypothetical protein
MFSIVIMEFVRENRVPLQLLGNSCQRRMRFWIKTEKISNREIRQKTIKGSKMFSKYRQKYR